MQYKPGMVFRRYLTRQKLTQKVPAIVVNKTIDYALIEEQYTYKRIEALSIEQELDAFNIPKTQQEELNKKLTILWIQLRVYEKILQIAPDKRWIKGTTIKQVTAEDATIIL